VTLTFVSGAGWRGPWSWWALMVAGLGLTLPGQVVSVDDDVMESDRQADPLRATSSSAASGTLTCARPGLPVAQGDLVGLGDVVGLDGSQSLA
jgi:hypothetical protein